MATDMERLIVALEARTTAFERAMNRANALSAKTARKIEADFIRANKSLSGFGKDLFKDSFRGLPTSIGTVLGVDQVRRYADAWTEAGNKIASASASTGIQARSLTELNKIANETRSGIGETVDLYAKLLRSTVGVAQSESEVARATEIVNKAFKAGGAAAQEQAAGILQLSQALGSGVLQGDELRSIRENAPILAKAIADEYGVAIAQLKQLGADGELTSDRVFKAILKAGPQIERQFGATTATVADGFTLLNNALTESVGRLNEVTGVGGEAGTRLAQLADIVTNLATVMETIAGSPAGKFIAFLDGVIKRLNPITAALDALSNKEVGESLSGLGKQDQGYAALKAETDRLAAVAARARLAASVRSGLSGDTGALPEKGRTELAALSKELRDGGDNAEEVKDKLVALGREYPQLASLIRQVIPYLEQLTFKYEENAAAAADAAAAANKINWRAAEDASMADLEKRTQIAKDVIGKQVEEADKTPQEREIEKQAEALAKAIEAAGGMISDASAKTAAKFMIDREEASRARGASASGAMGIIRDFEKFRADAYWDVNHYRAGYGSDTTTRADGSVVEIVKGMTVTLADAERDLARRIGEFQDGIRSKIGAGTFDAMTGDQQAALTSIAYNYGSLPDRIVAAIRSGGDGAVYTAIKGLGGDNGGINRGRRQQEADLYLSGASPVERQAVTDREEQAATFKTWRDRIAAIQEETAAMTALNPLVDDYGQALATLQAAQQLLADEQARGSAAGRELASAQQLLTGDLSKLTPEARKQAEAMRELAIRTGEVEAAQNQAGASQQRFVDSTRELSGFSKNVLSGFIRDLREGKSWTDALAGAIEKLADRLLDVGLDALIDGPNAGSLGGPLGGIIGTIGKLFGFASGTADTGGTRGQPRGIVHGREAVIPLPDGGKVPVDLRGVAAPSLPDLRGAAGRSMPDRLLVSGDIGVTVDDEGKVQAYVRRMGVEAAQAGAQQGVREVKRSLQGWQVEIGRNGGIA